MRPLHEMDVLQIETTNACVRTCANCTRFVGHRRPVFLTWEQFTAAVDATADFPRQVGLMGGEPLLHRRFPDMLTYMRERIPRERIGLWTTLPDQFQHYAPLIAEHVGNIYINDHTREDIYHAPLLVAAEDVYKDDTLAMWSAIEQCWVQNAWSASINQKGAYFCEVAAALALLFDGPDGWPVEPGWWHRFPKDFTAQQEWACPKCGGAVPLPRRKSVDDRDDVSPANRERLLQIGSYRERKGLLVDSPLKVVASPERMAAYKDCAWREKVANRFGLTLLINTRGFWDPRLLAEKTPSKPSLFEQYQAAYAQANGGGQ